MKKLLTGFAVTVVAMVWMMGSWFFFNSIAVGAQGSAPAAAAEVNKGDPQDTGAAEVKCGEHHCKHGHGRHHLLEKLNLTDAQKNQVHSIMAEERTKMQPLVQKLKEGREQIRALGKNGQFDEAKVRTAAKGQADVRTELIVEKERVKSKIYAVLTPEQRAQAEQMRESFKARHGADCKHKD